MVIFVTRGFGCQLRRIAAVYANCAGRLGDAGPRHGATFPRHRVHPRGSATPD